MQSVIVNDSCRRHEGEAHHEAFYILALTPLLLLTIACRTGHVKPSPAQAMHEELPSRTIP